MKTKLFFLGAVITFCTTQIEAQNRTQIHAMNSEVSANLDLRAVASVFGDSRNLEDFERRLNDPKLQLSNLDLNNDNQVDYLRVVESIENQAHFILIQAIVNRDVYQDVATIDVTKDYDHRVTIQIVGNTNLYGPNYIYEPVYYSSPSLLSLFWTSNYRPYYSNWKWNHYPKHYATWNPYPIYKYRNTINFYLNNSSYYGSKYPSIRMREQNHPNYNYLSREKYKSNQREFGYHWQQQNNRKDHSSRRNDSQESNTTYVRPEPTRGNYRRDTPQNKPLEIREVTSNRKSNQYISSPPLRENKRGSNEIFRRN